MKWLAMRIALLLLAAMGCTGQLGVGIPGVAYAPAPAPAPAPAAAQGGVAVGQGGIAASGSAHVAFSLDIQFYGVPLGSDSGFLSGTPPS